MSRVRQGDLQSRARDQQNVGPRTHVTRLRHARGPLQVGLRVSVREMGFSIASRLPCRAEIRTSLRFAIACNDAASSRALLLDRRERRRVLAVVPLEGLYEGRVVRDDVGVAAVSLNLKLFSDIVRHRSVLRLVGYPLDD